MILMDFKLTIRIAHIHGRIFRKVKYKEEFLSPRGDLAFSSWRSSRIHNIAICFIHLSQGFSAMVLLTTGWNDCLLWGCPAHCCVFSCTRGLYPPDTNRTHFFSVVTTKYVFIYFCQMSHGGGNCPCLRISDLTLYCEYFGVSLSGRVIDMPYFIYSLLFFFGQIFSFHFFLNHHEQHSDPCL
jgi:hypothetical protein